MLANVENVVKWLELQNLEWWTVYTTNDDNTKVFDAIDDETLEMRKKRFRDTMEIATGNRFIIKAKRNKSDGRGIFREEFINNVNDTKEINNPLQTIGNVGISESDVDKRIQEALKKAEQERELTELQIEVEELKEEIKERDNITTRFMQKLDPYIGAIAGSLINKFVPDQPAISIASLEKEKTETVDIDDFENVDTEQSINDIELRIENALKKWSNADPDFLTLLEAVAEMAAKKDPTYSMAKKFINK